MNQGELFTVEAGLRKNFLIEDHFESQKKSLTSKFKPTKRFVFWALFSLFLQLGAFGSLQAKAPGPGDLDPSFGIGGIVTTHLRPNLLLTDLAKAVAIQSDGKIVVTGTSAQDAALARYNPDGTLDTATFGIGYVILDFGGSDSANAIALQSDDKIVVAGTTDASGNTDFAVARYCRYERLDNGSNCGPQGFGSGGKVTTDFTPVQINPPPPPSDAANAVAVYPPGSPDEGKIVVAGNTTDTSGNVDIAIARYCADGRLDNGLNCGQGGFHAGGKVSTDYLNGSNDFAKAIVLQPDGKILVAGYSTYRFVNFTYTNFILLRYLPTGSLDPAFGGGSGIVTTGFGGNDIANAMALQPDGKILVVGETRTTGNNDFALARYNPDGTLDTTFGTGGTGTMTIDFAPSGNPLTLDRATAVALQQDGKILVAGSSAYASNNDFALVRLDTKGNLDLGFGNGGKVITDLKGYDTANAMAIQSDGKIVVAGSTNASGNGGDFALVRYMGGEPPRVLPSPPPPPSNSGSGVSNSAPSGEGEPGGGENAGLGGGGFGCQLHATPSQPSSFSGVWMMALNILTYFFWKIRKRLGFTKKKHSILKRFSFTLLVIGVSLIGLKPTLAGPWESRFHAFAPLTITCEESAQIQCENEYRECDSLALPDCKKNLVQCNLLTDLSCTERETLNN